MMVPGPKHSDDSSLVYKGSTVRPRALITGASRGIGRACAYALAENGFDLVLTGRDDAALSAVVRDLGCSSAQVRSVTVDLGERAGVNALLDAISGNDLQIDALINNAGIGTMADPHLLTESSTDAWERSLFVNLTVPYLLMRGLIPPMIARGYGRIVNVASIVGKVGLPYGAAYVASKHGLLGLTRTAAAECGSTGVTINAVCPGPTKTMTNDSRLSFESDLHGVTIDELERRATPLGRRITVQEVAALVSFLCSERASAINGQALNVDGGLIGSASSTV